MLQIYFYRMAGAEEQRLALARLYQRSELFLIQAVRGLQWLSRLVGAVELTLGLAIWFVGVSSVTLHIGLGIAMTLILVIISAIALFTAGIRSLGVIGIVYACILPALGMGQLTLHMGSLQWLVQSLHLLIGIGSIGVIHWIGGRYLRLKRISTQAMTMPEQAAVPQSSQLATSDER
jgi:uncharacterized membrane protein